MAALKKYSPLLLITSFFLIGSQCAIVQEAPPDARKAYEAAQHDLTKKRYEEAKFSFEQILTNYPQSDYADNALFRLGYIACIGGRYEAAYGYFSALIEDYGNSEWVFDARTWLGLLEEWQLLSKELEKTKAQLGFVQKKTDIGDEIQNDATERIDELQSEISRLREENNNLRLLIETLEE